MDPAVAGEVPPRVRVLPDHPAATTPRCELVLDRADSTVSRNDERPRTDEGPADHAWHMATRRRWRWRRRRRRRRPGGGRCAVQAEDLVWRVRRVLTRRPPRELDATAVVIVAWVPPSGSRVRGHFT